MVSIDGSYDRRAVAQIFRRVSDFFFYAGDVADLMEVVYDGLASLRLARDLRMRAKESAQEWSEADQVQNDAFDARVTQAEKLRDEEYGLLHGNALMGLWGAAEAAVEDVASLWFQARPDAQAIPELQRIKVSLGELLGLDRAAQARLVVHELQQQQRSDSKLGVGQFESLLEPLGLGGPVSKDVRREILRAQQARHLIAHRGGVVDARFLQASGWDEYSEGDVLKIGKNQFQVFSAALCEYVIGLVQRVEEVTSKDEQFKEVFASYRAAHGPLYPRGSDLARPLEERTDAPQARPLT